VLSQLTLRFPKKLIERLKNRAATENTSVNALAERLMESSLQDSAAGEEYLRLVTDPDEAVRQLYRQLILGQTFGAAAPSRDTLQFMVELAHQAYRRGQGQLVSMSRLRVLLDMTFELLAWQVENGQPVDAPYLKGIFGMTGEDWRAESERFMAGLTPAVTQDYAEHLLRPLASRAFDLYALPDEAIATIFTRSRLKAVFPLCMYARDWSFSDLRRFTDQVRPVVPAARETLQAGTLRFEIRISGQEPDSRPGEWYEMPRLYLLVSGQEFVMPFGWAQFSELLRTLSVYHHDPAVLTQGFDGSCVVFATRVTASQDVMLGLDALRVYLPEAGFAELARSLVTRCEHGQTSQALEGLRCLYGDL